MKKCTSFLVKGFIIIIMAACSGVKNSPTQPLLGTRSVNIIEDKGFRFKDLNRNGKLDPYEDWRLTHEERSHDLLSQMSLEQKTGLMVIHTLNMLGSRNAEISGFKYSPSDLDDGQVKGDATGRFAGFSPTETTSVRVKEFHNRHFILRLNESARIIAEWNNKLQELCESEPLGIPATITSNPRNHITSNALMYIDVAPTVFTAWPGELGLSATRDLSLIREFADISRQEWLSTGIRKGYMYMADLATEPRWSRVSGTFGEDPDWVAKTIREIVIGFQGEEVGPSSVALTVKHFPGGGSGKDGFDSHNDYGKQQVFPGGRFEENITPFKSAIEAGVSAIMPYYSLPYGTKFEEVGYAFNQAILKGVLRDSLGFVGIINSDTGPLDNMPWGVENLTIQERYIKALQAGVNLISGVTNPSIIMEVVANGSVDMSLIDNSVLLLLDEKFRLGLFENPYVDENVAEQIVNNEGFREKAAVALRKSIVLLRNDNKILPLGPNTKVYFESLQRTSQIEHEIYMNNDGKYEVEFVKTPEAADVIIFWVIPTGDAVLTEDGDALPISLSLSERNINTDYINKITKSKKTVLVINYSNPWVIDEIYNNKTLDNINGVLATFGTTPEALLDVLTGRVNPTGKMPFTTPISDEAVKNQLEDVPGYLEPEGYALFKFNEGLNYK